MNGFRWHATPTRFAKDQERLRSLAAQMSPITLDRDFFRFASVRRRRPGEDGPALASPG